MILYIENPTDATRKLLELISEFSKVAGYKINTQKSAAFLYTNSKRSEREIKEMIPFSTDQFFMCHLCLKRMCLFYMLGANFCTYVAHIFKNLKFMWVLKQFEVYLSFRDILQPNLASDISHRVSGWIAGGL